MTIFDRLDRMTSRRIDRMFAVAFTITPMQKTPNGRGEADPQRGEIVGKGVFDQVPALSPLEIGARDRNGNDFRSLATGNCYEMSVDSSRYPAVKDTRQGDRVTLDDARKFEVTSVEPDGLSRVVLQLVRL